MPAAPSDVVALHALRCPYGESEHAGVDDDAGVGGRVLVVCRCWCCVGRLSCEVRSAPLDHCCLEDPL